MIAIFHKVIMKMIKMKMMINNKMINLSLIGNGRIQIMVNLIGMHIQKIN